MVRDHLRDPLVQGDAAALGRHVRHFDDRPARGIRRRPPGQLFRHAVEIGHPPMHVGGHHRVANAPQRGRCPRLTLPQRPLGTRHPHGVPNRRLEPVSRQAGLGEEIRGASFHQRDRSLGIARTRQHDDRHVEAPAPDLSQQFQPRPSRQLVVEQHAVARQRRQRGQRHLGIGRLFDRGNKPRCTDRPPDRHAIDGVIIDHEQSQWRLASSRRLAKRTPRRIPRRPGQRRTPTRYHDRDLTASRPASSTC